MKKIILSISAILFSTGSIFAQTASVDLDINNVRAKMLTAGDMFFNPTSQNAAYEFPKNSGKNSMYEAGLWVAGKDATSGLLKVAAQTYRQEGTDFLGRTSYCKFNNRYSHFSKMGSILESE